MTRLHEISVKRSISRKGDIVYIHGLDGDWRETWEAEGDKDKFWPEWVAEDIPEVTVWSLEYDVPSTLWKAGTSMSLPDRALNVLAALEASGVGDRDLIFVTHSLGGLLVKQMLPKSQTTLAIRNGKGY